RFQEETPDEGSNRQRGRTEEESNPNETSDKTNKSTSKSSPTKSNKQKQQRFQEETPSEGSNRQWRRAEKESDPNETIDKTNNKGFKKKHLTKNLIVNGEEQKKKSILKSAKSTKPTQEESDDEVIEIEPPNIPKVVKDDQGNERMIDDDDTDLEAENLKLKKQIEEVQVENAKLQRENNRLFDENHFLTRINKAFADKNDDLCESLNRYSKIHLPKAIHRQTDLEQPAKCPKRIKTKKSERYEEESEEERSDSNNNDEYDEKEAKAEMKSILKTIDETRGLDYNETFNSAKNLKIRRKLVPELRSALAPCFPASNKQLTKWLGCLHKSRRSHQRLMDRGKADENKHRVHSNNRVHD
ncbi:12557_t:CDS:2, partial [Rhizophagus irregularis]